jgi:hypothetical protein
MDVIDRILILDKLVLCTAITLKKKLPVVGARLREYLVDLVVRTSCILNLLLTFVNLVL